MAKLFGLIKKSNKRQILNDEGQIQVLGTFVEVITSTLCKVTAETAMSLATMKKVMKVHKIIYIKCRYFKQKILIQEWGCHTMSS